jgi:hypothetical protein
MNRRLRFARLSNDALQRNSMHQVAVRAALAIYGLGGVYTFIPKNACSTLRYSLAIHNGFLREGDDPEWIHNNNETFYAEQRQLIEARYTFVVLRCPYRRLASAFLDKVVSADQVARVLVAKSGSTADIEAVRGPDIHALCFADFVRTCLAPPSRYVDFHWYPQVNFLIYEDYDDWFSLEKFDVATEQLENRGFKVHDTRSVIDHSTVKFEKVSGNFARVPAGEIYRMKREGKVPTYEALFDDETRALVPRLFRKDIEVYIEKFGASNLLFPS